MCRTGGQHVKGYGSGPACDMTAGGLAARGGVCCTEEVCAWKVVVKGGAGGGGAVVHRVAEAVAFSAGMEVVGVQACTVGQVVGSR